MIQLEARIAKLAETVAALLVSDQTIGFGSGSTAEAVVKAIANRCAIEPEFKVTGVATSIKTADLARSLGIPILDLGEVKRIDLGFDGADEIDPLLNLVKGKGGALLYEKLVAEICDDYVVVSSEEKLVRRLGTRLPLPVEVIPYGWVHISSRLEQLGLEPILREIEGSPYVTDAKNYILDCTPKPGTDVLASATAIKCITGVVEHGIFQGIARRAVVITAEGETKTLGPGWTI